MAKVHGTEPVVFSFVQRPRPSIDPSPLRQRQAGQCVVSRFPAPSGRLAQDGPEAQDTHAPVQPRRSEGQAWIDALTGLPNHVAFYRRLRRATRLAAFAGHGVALFVVDVDDFGSLNDAYGAACGDAILSGVAHRLSAGPALAQGLARIDADGFAFAIAGPDVVAGAPMTAHRIKRAFRVPFLIGGFAIPTTVSVGIGLFPGHATTADNLIAAALRGTHIAKRRGGDRVAGDWAAGTQY